MKTVSRCYKRLRGARPAFVLAATMLSLAACDATSKPSSNAETSSAAPAPSSAPTSSEEPQFLFVQCADDLEADADASTLRLVNVSQQTIYFSDRPQRIAGHLTMADYLEEWTVQAGEDNFGGDPPNATLSVYEQGQPDNTIVVVEITDPVVEGADLIYSYRIIDGSMPQGGGATALFIDTIGPGGGVGVGYHGVGVGARGPGVR